MRNPIPLSTILDFLKTKDTFIFLDNSLYGKENRYSYIFTDPVKIITCHDRKEVKNTLKKMDKARERGYYLCGFISYEAGYAFIENLRPDRHYSFPLIWMGVFTKPVVFDCFRTNQNFSYPGAKPAADNIPPYSINNLRLNISRPQYLAAIKKIRRLIAAGDTYQVNYTMKYLFDFSGSPFAFYRGLRAKQKVSYGAFIKSADFSLLSFSPELFFRQDKDIITVRPMKGTIIRGRNAQEDRQRKNSLKHDTKNRAENIMIVDLLRNDLGRISRTGSVKVKELFRVEPYLTLSQMTSTISSKLKKNISIFDLLSSIFPSGSVTGAPKIRTMEIIRELEKEERKVYTGAIGFFSPRRKAVFNVAIRTVLLQKDKGEMGIGSGITYSSQAEQEYEECLLKARFLTSPAFRLIETMLWTNKKGFFLLDYHLKRLKQSARFFGFKYSGKTIRRCLDKSSATLKKDTSYRFRLLLSGDASVHIEHAEITAAAGIALLRIVLSARKTNPDDIFLYHKTTNRTLYDREYEKYKSSGYYDVIFQNIRNELTEGAISNIFIKKDGRFYTPAVSCGLLPGVFRTYYLERHPKTEEKILTVKDLALADEIYVANSVRGMVRVFWDKQTGQSKVVSKIL
ncbi:MAG: aminodeoxychorismate synthase component I [Candidatus Omnitrophica bacterium]|nr:aminodeoxychorismate synthase component I [Candidatus Omnitrophota bacterium]